MHVHKPASFFLGGGGKGRGGVHESRRHSTTGFRENVVVAAEISYQMLVVLSFCDSERA